MVKSFRQQSTESYEAVEPIDFQPLKGNLSYSENLLVNLKYVK